MNYYRRFVFVGFPVPKVGKGNLLLSHRIVFSPRLFILLDSPDIIKSKR
jgi:hypothetical protein